MLVLCVALLATLGSGCARQPTGITSVWPEAVSEATVAPPPGLGRYPLTGLQVPEDAVVPTTPVCTVVHDAGGRAVAGVSRADIVYETGDSSSGTNLACLFGSAVPARMGPIGPAGLPHLWIGGQYRAMVFSAGTTGTIATSMQQQGVANGSLGADPAAAAAYAGSTVRGSVAAELAARVGSTVTSAGPVRVRFSASSSETGTPAWSVTVPWSNSRPVQWRYDRRSGRYGRLVGGSAQKDQLDGSAISARNVVVMWAQYAPVDADVAGGGGYDITFKGSGKVSLFRDGQKIDGRWKADGQTPPRFFAENGQTVKLGPGQTWIEVIPLSANITFHR
jgi:hypothetical protein